MCRRTHLRKTSLQNGSLGCCEICSRTHPRVTYVEADRLRVLGLGIRPPRTEILYPSDLKLLTVQVSGGREHPMTREWTGKFQTSFRIQLISRMRW